MTLLYNNLLKKNKLRKYEEIQEGDKIKFIVLRELFQLEKKLYLLLHDSKEFNLHEYIDFDEQFDKSFLELLRFIVNAINWNFEKQATLDNFFNMSKEIEELKKQIDKLKKLYIVLSKIMQIKKDLKEHIGEIWDIYKKLKKVITVSSF